jgi:hypothetical protein
MRLREVDRCRDGFTHVTQQEAGIAPPVLKRVVAAMSEAIGTAVAIR